MRKCSACVTFNVISQGNFHVNKLHANEIDEHRSIAKMNVNSKYEMSQQIIDC